MFYYIVNKTGDGTRDNAVRPDFEGSFVWNPDAVCPHCGTYILASSEDVPDTAIVKRVTDMESACSVRSVPPSEVYKWMVGDS